MKTVLHSSSLFRRNGCAEISKFIARKPSGDFRSFHGVGRFCKFTSDLVGTKQHQSSHFFCQQRPVMITCSKVSYSLLKIIVKMHYDRVAINIIYIIIRVHSAFSLVASCVLLKYTRTDDVN